MQESVCVCVCLNTRSAVKIWTAVNDDIGGFSQLGNPSISQADCAGYPKLLLQAVSSKVFTAIT